MLKAARWADGMEGLFVSTMSTRYSQSKSAALSLTMKRLMQAERDIIGVRRQRDLASNLGAVMLWAALLAALSSHTVFWYATFTSQASMHRRREGLGSNRNKSTTVFALKRIESGDLNPTTKRPEGTGASQSHCQKVEPLPLALHQPSTPDTLHLVVCFSACLLVC